MDREYAEKEQIYAATGSGASALRSTRATGGEHPVGRDTLFGQALQSLNTSVSRLEGLTLELDSITNRALGERPEKSPDRAVQTAPPCGGVVGELFYRLATLEADLDNLAEQVGRVYNIA